MQRQLHPQSLWSSDTEDTEAAKGRGSGPFAQWPAGQRGAIAASSCNGIASGDAAGAAGAPTAADMACSDDGAGGAAEVSSRADQQASAYVFSE